MTTGVRTIEKSSKTNAEHTLTWPDSDANGPKVALQSEGDSDNKDVLYWGGDAASSLGSFQNRAGNFVYINEGEL